MAIENIDFELDNRMLHHESSLSVSVNLVNVLDCTSSPVK